MANAAPVKKSAPVKKTAPVAVAAKSAVAAKPAVAEKYSLVNLRDDVVASMPLVSRATVEKVLLSAFATMTKAYAAGKCVNIKDFGKLEIKHRPARVGRNPATGDPVNIPAKTVPKFTFAKALKDAV